MLEMFGVVGVERCTALLSALLHRLSSATSSAQSAVGRTGGSNTESALRRCSGKINIKNIEN